MCWIDFTAEGKYVNPHINFRACTLVSGGVTSQVGNGCNIPLLGRPVYDRRCGKTDRLLPTQGVEIQVLPQRIWKMAAALRPLLRRPPVRPLTSPSPKQFRQFRGRVALLGGTKRGRGLVMRLTFCISLDASDRLLFCCLSGMDFLDAHRFSKGLNIAEQTGPFLFTVLRISPLAEKLRPMISARES